MTPSEPRTDKTIPPAGAAGDGMDAYPTYHDGSTPVRGAAGTHPTDVNLPRPRRTYALPLLIGLAVFALVLVVSVIMGSMNAVRTTDDAFTSGDAAAPTGAAPAAGAPATAGTDVPEPEGELDGDGQAQPATGPGEVEAEPGDVDVPGGATTTPVQPAPAQ